MNTKIKGALLLELLIVVSILGIIIFTGANAVFLSMKSSEASRERDVGSTLANETLQAVRSVIEENWQNVYSLQKNDTHYFTSQSNNKWIISPVSVSTDETVFFNNKNYTRYITVSNVSRNALDNSIEDTYTALLDDPSTQKVSVTVISPEGYNTNTSAYFFRWKNKICDQASWVTGGSGDNVTTCSGSSSYDTIDTGVDVTGGVIKLK